MPFLAKDSGQTIKQHNIDLLKQLELLKTNYPNILSSTHWQILKLACEYHDLGKINPKFQQKLNKNIKMMPGEVYHNLLSANLIDIKTLKHTYDKTDLKTLTHAVALHHDRFLNSDQQDIYQQGVKSLIEPAKQLTIDVPINPDLSKPISQKWYALGKYPQPADSYYLLYVLIKGLLNRLDYAASGYYNVESQNRSLLNQNILPVLRKDLDEPNLEFNPLQKFSLAHQNDNLLITAQTGIGKTESAINWLNNDKSFFILPLRSASSAIYNRLHNKYKIDKNHLALLTSDTQNVLSNNVNNETEYFQQLNESKNLSKQLTIATIDQIFSFVFHYKGFEEKLATVAYSKIVIDEIQMYEPNLLAYIIFGLKELQQYNTKFQIMTATLSPFVVDLLKQQNINFIQPKPFIDKQVDHRHSVKINHQQLTTDEIVKHYAHNKLLVIVNTVKKAQSLFTTLKQALPNESIHMIHSRFINQDRRHLEEEIQNFTKNDDSGIWIGTQVVEASLDIDFDCLLTELSELNGLFQRMGRCYRKRNFKPTQDHKYNIFVYDGGQDNPSGIRNNNKSVVNYQLFSLSKLALKNIDSFLTEEDKLTLINQNYTTENLSKTTNYNEPSYLEQVQQCLTYLKQLQTKHISKSDMQAKFRNIDSVNAIPLTVYQKNKTEIDNQIKILEDKASSRIAKNKAHNKINQFEINIQSFMLFRSKNPFIPIHSLNDAHYKVLSKDFTYDHQTGLQ